MNLFTKKAPVMKLPMRVILGVVALAGVLPLSTGVVAQAFDSGRFGDDAPTATATGTSLSGSGAVATGGIQVAPIKDEIIVHVDDKGNYTAETSALGVDKTNTPEGKQAILDAQNGAGEGAGTDPTQTGAVDSTQAAKDAKSQKMCGMDSASAAQMAGDDAALQSTMASKGVSGASAACKQALKAGLQACAKGDEAAMAKSMEATDKDCATEEPELVGADVATPTPVATTPMEVVQNAGAALQQGVQQAQGMIGKMMGGSLMPAGGMQGILNMVGQQMASQLMEKLMGGETSGSSSGSDGSGSYKPPADNNPTCDKVTSTKDATKVEVVSAVTVTTVLQIDSCKNGHLRTRSTITMQYPNGTSETKNSETIK